MARRRVDWAAVDCRSLAAADAALSEAVVALFASLLPNNSHAFVRGHVARKGASTVVLVRPEGRGAGLLADAGDAEAGKTDKTKGKRETDAEEDEDEDEDETSGFSTDTEDEDASSDERQVETVEAPRGVNMAERRAWKSRLIGAVTYSFAERGVLEIVLVGVRRCYQRSGAGGRLLKAALDAARVGAYDVAFTHADVTAVDFFARHGFVDDPVFNEPFKAMSEDWDSSVVMSYVPARPASGVLDVEGGIAAVRESHRAAYRDELMLMRRMASEIRELRAQVAQLSAENAALRAGGAAAGGAVETTPVGEAFGRWAQVRDISPLEPSAAQRAAFAAASGDAGRTMTLFYGAPRRRIDDICANGFRSPDAGEYGIGIYMSRGADRAHVWTEGARRVIYCQVAVGDAETVVRKDATRSSGADSLCVPARVHAGETSASGEEYLVFDLARILPLAAVTYDV